jgi:peptidoglycan-associated lipoprotein
MTGCPKKTVIKEEPSTKKSEEVAREAAREAARIEAERAKEAKEAKEKELARIKEEEAKKAQEKKEFEQSLVARKTPGIEGEVFETKLLKDIHFDFDKYDILQGDAEILKGNAALLVKFPNVKIQIEGHCDERGTVEYNLALGERRANSVRNYMISLGISGNRISIISYGKERPMDPAHNEDAWAKNRRAHSVIVSK